MYIIINYLKLILLLLNNYVVQNIYQFEGLYENIFKYLPRVISRASSKPN